MKRLISLIVTGGLVLSLCACDTSDTDETTELTEETKIVETIESETSLVETSETTVLEETTTVPETETETETETEIEIVEVQQGSVFLDCSDKAADQIVNNVIAIRTIGSGVTHESYADRFTVRPDFFYDHGDTITIYNWDSKDVKSNVYITQVILTSNVDPDDVIIVDQQGCVDIMIFFSDLDVAIEVYEAVRDIVFEDYKAILKEGETANTKDNRDESVWKTECDVPRYVSLNTVANDEGLYQLDISIDLK